jgi:hypothetical protein
MTILSEI